MKARKISVCMATYNGGKFIEEQVVSILNQLGQQDELIISDDHSSDDTLAIILSFREPRIRLLTHSEKSGPVKNFEHALTHATGDVIFLADQDDVWLPDKVITQLDLLERYDLVVSDAAIIDENGNLLHPSFFKINYSGKGFVRNWINNSFMGCCMAFNRKILEYALPFPAKIAMHDSWIGLNAMMVGSCCFLEQPLIYYRRHGMNTMPSFKKNHLPVSYQVSYRLHMMYHILKRRFSTKLKTA